MNKTTSIKASDLNNQELYHHLSSAVAPRPICFASTVDKDGNVNLSPFSFFNVFSASPPILIFSPARRGRDNSTKDTHNNVLEVPEVVINTVNYNLVEQMSLTSTEYDSGVNEFLKAGLTEVKSNLVSPPRVGESPVSFECIVDNVIPLGNEGGSGNLVICRVVMIHLKNEYLDSKGQLDTKKLDLVARMGKSWYSRANEQSLFEITKPLSSKGIGVDQLPQSIRLSKVLTGNDLGRLGTLEKLPSVDEIHDIGEEEKIVEILDNTNSNEDKIKNLHLLASEYLKRGNIEFACRILIFSDMKES